jgi:hypothetical protein
MTIPAPRRPLTEAEIAALAETANAALQDLDIVLGEVPDGLAGAALLECARLADTVHDVQRRLRALGAELVG